MRLSSLVYGLIISCILLQHKNVLTTTTTSLAAASSSAQSPSEKNDNNKYSENTHNIDDDDDDDRSSTNTIDHSGTTKPNKAAIAFGEGGLSSKCVPIVDLDSSISPKVFFSKYVKSQQPVLFKRVIQQSRAYNLWTDKYFQQLRNIPAGHEVVVESRKKENRTATPTHMPFKEFVEIYNLTDQYMVEPVPSFLRKDFTLPHHLQCEQLMRDIIVEAFMWFSSGGTSSVVHTDSVENMNCLVAGRKRFVFVSPQQSDLVLFDHPEGSYSGIDVDNVDYTIYPGLANVDFFYADVEAGDCLYIPYKWIHQVRSYDRNIAVNIWWDTFRNRELNLDKCDSRFDPDWSLDRVDFMGFQALDNSPAIIREHVTGIMTKDSPDIDNFLYKLGLPIMEQEDFKKTIHYELMLEAVKKMFRILDVDKNGKADGRDLEELTNDHWLAVGYQFNVLNELAEEYEESVDEVDHERDYKDEL